MDASGLPHSEQLTLTERLRVLPDGGGALPRMATIHILSAHDWEAISENGPSVT